MTALSAAAVMFSASLAAAHVEVTGTPARAGGAGAVLTFVAEAESQSAGITSMQVVLPAGIAADDVAYVDGPSGWALKSAAGGFTAAGPALPKRKDAQFRVRVRVLPQAKTLVFKVLETYTDGKISRWIGEPGSGADNPAPVLTLAPAAPGSPSAAPASPSAQPSPPISASLAPASSPSPAKAGSGAGTGAGPGLWAALWVLVLAAAGGLAVFVRRRKTAR